MKLDSAAFFRILSARLMYSSPRFVRWPLTRELSGQPARWVQKLYNSDDAYTLKGFREKRCIFVHIPKCGGISINSALFGNNGAAHASVEDYLGVFGSRWFDSAFKFTFLRNPETRLLSAFHFLRAGGMNKWDAEFAAKNLLNYSSVSEFIEKRLGDPEIMNFPHFRKQCSFVFDPRRHEKLEGAIDFFGRFEFMEQDFGELCDRLGVENKLAKKNATNYPCLQPEISRRAARLIRKVYAEDYELWERLF